ncbi:MAG: bile acid:sodium symporter [Acidimicrobiia bacterium]|nr:bile acid:sodium symporter [Acidimicrobiia bacterium]
MPLELVEPLTRSALVAMMLSMGFRSGPADVLASIRDLRGATAGLAANFVLVPAATMGLLYAFDAVPVVSAGFLILAVCPGAPVGPPFAAVARGDVPYASGQMVILASVSAVVSPALLGLLLARLLPAGGLQVDFLAIVRILAISQILPLCTGLVVSQLAPGVARRLAGPVGLAASLLLLVVIALVLVGQFELLRLIGFGSWTGMFLLMASCLAIGWLCGGPGLARRKALAVTTASRNAAVALVIVSGSFAGTAAVTAVVAYALASILTTFGCALLFARMTEPAR